MIPVRDANPTQRAPLLTFLIVVSNVIFFLTKWYDGANSFQESITKLGLIPSFWLAERCPMEPVLTSMFMHGSWIHLIGNMWFLWIFSDNVEDRLGVWRFLLLYFLSGLGAVALHVISRPDSMVPLVGASGAISGILGAYMVFFPKARIIVWWPLFYFNNLPAGLFIGMWFVIQFLSLGFQSLITEGNVGGVAYWAHIGGFVVGWVFGQIWKGRVQRSSETGRVL